MFCTSWWTTMVRSFAHQELVKQEEEEEGEAELVMLPDELVERIVAMVPFPEVFKFRVLSKAWQARLSAISPQDDDEKKGLALSFRRQISQRSSTWKSFCPVSLSDNMEDSIAFDRSSNTWLSIPLPSSLQRKIRCDLFDTKRASMRRDLRMDGALLLLPISRNEQFIVNILTGSWKQLSPCPHRADFGKTLLSHRSETYKVFVMPHARDGHNFIQIYDSTSAAWSTLKLDPSLNYSLWEPVAFLDGVLYVVTAFVSSHPDDPYYNKVLSIKIKEDSLEVETSAQDFNVLAVLDGKFVSVNPVICKPNLLILFFLLYVGVDFVEAMHIDLETGELLLVSPCPNPRRPKIRQASVANPITGCDDIIASVNLREYQVWAWNYNLQKGRWMWLPHARGQVLTYNVLEDKWMWLHSSDLVQLLRDRPDFDEQAIRSCYFRPGLNPFAEV